MGAVLCPLSAFPWEGLQEEGGFCHTAPTPQPSQADPFHWEAQVSDPRRTAALNGEPFPSLPRRSRRRAGRPLSLFPHSLSQWPSLIPGWHLSSPSRCLLPPGKVVLGWLICLCPRGCWERSLVPHRMNSQLGWVLESCVHGGVTFLLSWGLFTCGGREEPY